MTDLNFSEDGFAVLPRMLGVDMIVYVENDEDVKFWKNYFKMVSNKIFSFIPKGGKEKLKKIIKTIENSNKGIIIAYDNDYDHLTGNEVGKNWVISTYGYSIENTLYCPDILSRIIGNICKKDKDYKKEIRDWYTAFEQECLEFLTYDFAAMMYGKKGIIVMGDSSAGYLIERSSHLDLSHVHDYICKLKEDFSEEEIMASRRKIEADNRGIRYLIRGHFLTNAVSNEMKEINYSETHKCFTMSSDAFFSQCIDGCRLCEGERGDCPDHKHLIEQIEKAVKYFS